MEKYRFDPAVFAALEKLRCPLAVYQFLEKRVVTIMLSDGFCDLFGFDDKAEAYYMMDHDMYEATHPDDRARIANAAFRFATEGGKYEAIYRTLTKNREGYKIVHALGEHVYTPEGVRLAYVWYTDEGSYTGDEETMAHNLNAAFRNALREESIINASHYDFLTGLPSMSYFFVLADEWRRSHIKNGGVAALLYMDLCGMKFFNRKHGFSEGDRLLQQFADILKEMFSNENCSRFGSDHFCVFTDARDLEDRLRDLFLCFIANSDRMTLPVRVGIYLDRDASLDISVECDRAKYACDTMRDNYLSNFRYFSEDMLEKTENRQYIIDHFSRAVSERWIRVYYQPIVRSTNGRVCHEEALARWNDPEKGMLSPAEFIPVLEEAKLIYLLDLCVVEQALEKIREQQDAGIPVVPVSVNLSRIDFDVCDIIEEIVRRVDESGITRDMLNIEITESAVGNGTDFMQEQVARFRELGFRVWMDDFGSGYSSLDVLQSIHFDMIKFDMHFMKEFNNSEKSRIILSELVKMTIALGMETVCEGVETKAQADFLREVGCTMMQGYYFSRPISYEEICMLHQKGVKIRLENNAESDYYAAVGKINLYDLSVIASEGDDSFDHYFNTLPMAVLETTDHSFTLLRCNRSFRDFMERMFGVVELGQWVSYDDSTGQFGNTFLQALREVGSNGGKRLFEEELRSDSVVHTFLKRIAVNPVNGNTAVTLAVLAVVDPKNVPVNFTQIIKALSEDYICFYNIDLETESYIEYQVNSATAEMVAERHGTHFFDECHADPRNLVADVDREMFNSTLTRENVLDAIERSGSFRMNYRVMLNGEVHYAELKAVRSNLNGQHILIGINNVDKQVRQKETLERMRQERIAYSRMSALSDEFICIYTINAATGHYTEYSMTKYYAALGAPVEGEDFFGESRVECERLLHPDDCEAFKAVFSKEHVLETIRKEGVFNLRYRMLLDGAYTKAGMKAVLVKEEDGEKIVVGVSRR